MKFSVVILTRDEAVNIRPALESCRGIDDVVVLDSFSTDATVEIARSCGARVVQRVFDSFAGQRNDALDSIALHHSWVFFLDADERFTPALQAECSAIVAADAVSGGMVASKTLFMGRWIRHASQYPVYQLRLVKRGEVRFEQAGHGQREGASRRPLARLREPYVHDIASKGLAEWMERHIRYARDEAAVILANRRGSAWRTAVCELWHIDPIRRRRALKIVAACLPMRPALRFLSLYLFSGGFLDGVPGLVYCRLMAQYEAMIQAFLRFEAGTPVPPATMSPRS